MPLATAPPALTDPGATPDRSDRTTFSARAIALDDFRKNTHIPELRLALANVRLNADGAFTDAGTASAQAAIATAQASTSTANAVASAASAGASVWVSGTTYAIDNVRYSPLNGRVYRRITTGAGATDPSADGTNWKGIDTSPIVVVNATAAATAITYSHYIMTNAAACTLTLPLSPASGDTVWTTFTNGLATNVIGCNGQTIMGIAGDMTVDSTAGLTVQLRFCNSSWRLI